MFFFFFWLALSFCLSLFFQKTPHARRENRKSVSLFCHPSILFPILKKGSGTQTKKRERGLSPSLFYLIFLTSFLSLSFFDHERNKGRGFLYFIVDLISRRATV